MIQKSVIAFDFDGTLADTTRLVHETIINSCNEYGHMEINEDNLESHFGPTESGIIRSIVGEKLFPEAWTFFLEEYIRIQPDTIKKIPGMDELLEELSKRNDILLVLVTGRSKVTTDISLACLGYERYFAKVYSGSEEGINKDKNIENLIHDYGVEKKDIIYVGDTIADIHTMHEKAGIDLLSVTYCQPDEAVKLEMERLNPGNLCPDVTNLRKRLFELLKQ